MCLHVYLVQYCINYLCPILDFDFVKRIVIFSYWYIGLF